MCGIAGWVVTDAPKPAEQRLRLMMDSIRHRGPDGAGVFLDRDAEGGLSVALGHRRLAIIDLAGGQQPMTDSEAGLALVFNGEIYNFRELRSELAAKGHRFATRSDTEVVLQAFRRWGTDAFRRFRGMFSVALWDRHHRRLVLARDPFGKKPLFIARLPHGLVFASEIKALIASGLVPAELNQSVLPAYFQYRYVPGPDTLYRGIEKIPPGSYAVWADGRLATSRFFVPPDHEPPTEKADTDTMVRHLHDALKAAVRARMVSDVPFGAFLSGGIDSSLVVAFMARQADRPVNTFSIGFDESQYSEHQYAEQVAEHFHTRHETLLYRAPSLVDHLQTATHFRDAPVAEPSDLPMMILSRAAAGSVKMVLTGEGSDEVMAGYPKHVVEHHAGRRGAASALRILARLAGQAASRAPFGLRRARITLAAAALADPLQRLPRWFGALEPEQADRLLTIGVEGAAPDRLQPPFDWRDATSPLRRALYFDQTSWLPDNLLERGDRMTMSASLEARMPFLDVDLVATVARFPDSARVRGCTTKWALRKVAQALLPRAIIERPKVGFRLPVSQWFRRQLRDYLRDMLLAPEARIGSLADRAAVARFVDEHQSGRRDHEKVLWTCLALEVFLREGFAAPDSLRGGGRRVASFREPVCLADA